MWSTFRAALAALDLEERILNGALLAAIIFLFFPWLAGQFLGGDPVSYSGIQFYHSYIGAMILLIDVIAILMTMLPLVGGPVIVKRPWRATVRLWLTLQSSVLTFAALTVLTRVTYEFRGLSIRYGVYFTLVCGLIATLYAFLQWQEERRKQGQELFHHPEDATPATQVVEPVLTQAVPPPPPPPPPLPPEEHNLRL